MRISRLPPSRRVWIFDLDNTLHDARSRIFPAMHDQINAFLKREFSIDDAGANAMRERFWRTYGTTLEGLAKDGQLHPVQKAWVEEQVPQCGFCQNGQIMTAKALLDRNPNPTDAQIREGMARTLCRCMTYYRVQAAIKLASRTMRAAVETPRKEVLA